MFTNPIFKLEIEKKNVISRHTFEHKYDLKEKLYSAHNDCVGCYGSLLLFH
jgi:hypothetical protein